MESRIHKLKTIQPYFDEVWYQNKTFEVRKNDRDFQVDDVVILREYDPVKDEFLGREVIANITYILKDYEFINPDYVVLAINITQCRTY